MISAATTQPSERHPWLDRFAADPINELDKLLSGQARVLPYEQADAPDVAQLLFGNLTSGDEAHTILDRTLKEWLESQRIGAGSLLEGLQLERWVRKVSEAFEIVSLLKLPLCSLDFRERFVQWNSWVESLTISASRDGRYAFWRSIALTQRVVIGKGPKTAPFAFEPFWLRICEQAGGGFPAHYLAVGLLGLRMLPERKETPSERAWMAGITRWAINQRPTTQDFSRQWWAIKELYPRMPAYWRTAVISTLEQPYAGELSGELKDWWLREVNATKGATAKSGARSGNVPKLSPPRVREALQKRAVEPLPSIRKEIEDLVDERRRYAEATGESYYLVATACSLGMEVLKGSDDPTGRGRLAADLALQALAWQPTNVFGWSLWRDALVVQGNFDAAEEIGWETIRRFPENPQWRNQLAELMIALNRIDDATAIVHEVFSRGLEDKASFDLKARLLFHSDGAEAAKDVLHVAVERFPHDEVLQHHLQKLQLGDQIPLLAAAFRIAGAPTDGLSHSDTTTRIGMVRLRGRLRRLFSKSRRYHANPEWRSKALDEVNRALHLEPNLGYAVYLKRELTGEDASAGIGSFALKYIAALKSKKAEQLLHLQQLGPSEAHLIDVAKMVLFRDPLAGERTLAWLKLDSPEPRSVSALRGFLRLRMDISGIHDGATLANIVADNDNIEIDLVEAALTMEETLLAA